MGNGKWMQLATESVVVGAISQEGLLWPLKYKELIIPSNIRGNSAGSYKVCQP